MDSSELIRSLEAETSRTKELALLMETSDVELGSTACVEIDIDTGASERVYEEATSEAEELGRIKLLDSLIDCNSLVERLLLSLSWR